MKTTITMCLLLAVVGLTLAHTVKRDASTASNDEFSAVTTRKETKLKMQEILLNITLEWQKINMFLSFAHKGANDVIDTKVKEQLDNVRLAVQNATEEGKDVEYCIKDSEDNLKAFQLDAQKNFTECTDTFTKAMTGKSNISATVLRMGQKVLEDIHDLYESCHMHIFNLSACLDIITQRTKFHLTSFDNILKFYPLYRKLVFDQRSEECVECLSARLKNALEDLNTIKDFSESCVNGAE